MVTGYSHIENIISKYHDRLSIKTWTLTILLMVVAITMGLSQPTVDTPTISAVGTTTATLGGNVTGTLTDRGTRWSTTSPVGTLNQLEEASTTAGAFTQARTSLPAASRIFFVAYARDGLSEGVAPETTFFTEPVQLTGGEFTTSATAPDAITLSFPSADSWKGTGVTAGYVIYRKIGSAPSVGAIADGSAPPADGVGDKIATVTDETFTSFNDSGLDPVTDYYYTIIPFVWDGATDATYNYNLVSPQTDNATTLAVSLTVTPITPGTGVVPSSSVLFAGTTTQVLAGFAVSSSGSQTINQIDFNYTPSTSIVEEYLYKNTVAGTLAGATIVNSDNTPDGMFDNAASLSEAITSTTVYYYLVVDVANSVTSSTTSITVNPTQANISVTSGIVNSFSINRAFTFSTSQLSDIILVPGGTTNSIDYRDYITNSINDDQSNSVTLADFQIRDGGASNDPDDKGMSVTSIELQITNSENLRKIALFDDDNNLEIPGTELAVLTAGITTLVFTPTTPISIADNGHYNLNVRAGFKSFVTDKASIQISIINVTASSTSLSGFSPVGTWADTQTANNTNVIAVVATELAFVANPPNTPVNTAFALSLQAIDDNSNLDLDYNKQIDLTLTTGPGTLSLKSPHTESLSPFLAAGVYNWTRLQVSQAQSYTLRARDDNYSPNPNYNSPTATVVITSSASTVTQPATLNLCFGGIFKTLGNIVITETDPAGFSSSGSFSIGLPTGYIFDTSVTTAPVISNGTASPTTLSYTGDNIVQFSYNFSAGSSNTNSITISGLKIRYPLSTPPAGGNNITRVGGTASIAGVVDGTVLGTLSAALGTPSGSVDFSVVKVNPGDVDVAPNETRFSTTGNAVRLIGTPTGISSEFTGPGVTFTAGQWRFNPSSLAVGTGYTITYKVREGADQCEFTVSKDFEVYATSITNLANSYCSNQVPSDPLSVSETYIDSRFVEYIFNGLIYVPTSNTYNFDGFVYYNPLSGYVDMPPITPGTPTTAVWVFDPQLPEYLSNSIYSNTELYYGTYGIWIGFRVRSTVTNNVSYEFKLIPVRQAPTATITSLTNSLISSNSRFCGDAQPVTLTGSPANSSSNGLDFFTVDSAPQAGSVSYSAGTSTWSFNPSAVVGVTESTPVTFNITYTFTDKVTNCQDTSPPVQIRVYDRPAPVQASDIATFPTQAICPGTPVNVITANPETGVEYKWYSETIPLDANPLNVGNSFNPPTDVLTPDTYIYNVTRTLGKEEITIFGSTFLKFAGCESNRGPSPPTPYQVSVTVKPIPAPPTIPSIPRDYCANSSIPGTDLQVTGTNVKWYLNGTSIYTGSSPTSADLGINNTIASDYVFSLTQTVAGCEGVPQTIAPFTDQLSVKIKPLPDLSIISSSVPDLNKICTGGGTIVFEGKDGAVPAANGVWSGTGLSGVLTPVPAFGTVNLNPLTLAPGTYTLQYNYTNPSTLCSKAIPINFNILPSINVVVSASNACLGSPIIITNNSTVNGIGTIQEAMWNFDDNSGLPFDGFNTLVNANDGRTTGTYSSPIHRYVNTGNYQIDGEMVTNDGCSYPIPPIGVLVSPLPKINFTWESVCRDELTGVSSTGFHATELSSPQIAIASYDWDFNLNSLLTHSLSIGGTASEPKVSYNSDGKDSVRLIVTTSFGCQDTVKKPVYIVPKFAPITDNNSYTQDFNISEDGWLIGGTNPSWEWGVPNQKGSEVLGSKGNVWDTRLNGTNNPNEQSWVLSRCFNFSQTLKPVIGLDIFSDTPSGVNGAAIQYNYNGNIEDDTNWITLGEVGKGINWFDATGISNSPGNQPTGTQVANDMGWTGNENTTNGKYKEWQRAYYRLDDLLSLTPAQKSNVVFRIAFAAGNSRSDGFAFDDFFIGERSRNVLLENFTNSSANVSAHNNTYRVVGNPNEIIKVQYHTPFPGDDPINKLNTPMHNGRTAFYGITKSPSLRLDGLEAGGGNIAKLYDDRVLTPSSLEITITPTKVNGVVEIVTSIRNKSSQVIPLAGTHLFTTIVEKNITTPGLLGNSGNTEFVFVGKQMLPSPTGLEIPTDLAAGATYTAPKVVWEINNGDAIVVSVQSIEGNNKIVYQAGVSLTPVQPDIILGIEHIAEFVQLYPNPANDSFVIELPTKADNRLTVHMIDQVGRLVHESTIETGEQTKTINTQELAGGIYVVQIGAGKSGAVRKKMMIVHKQ